MEILDQLNPEQREAVTTTEGPLLVLAGAGSGKTRVVTLRIIYLLQMGVPPSRILGLTFTNKAAGEMKERVRTITQSDVWISTFHSLGVRILREAIHVLGYNRDFTIYDADDSEKVVNDCLQEMGFQEAKPMVKDVKHFISHSKNQLLDPQKIKTKGSLQKDEIAVSVYEKYQEKLKQYNAVDFDDLLFLPVKIFQEFPAIEEIYANRWSYLLIDEYQDTNHAQYVLIKHLVEKTGNLCIVGDPDQSIYSWRGANIENIMNFESDYPTGKVIRLEQNYRSRSNILEAANEVVARNQVRYDKKLWSDRGAGQKIEHFRGNTDKEEAQYVAERLKHHHEHNQVHWSHMVVFYRTHAQSRAFEDLFYLRHIPYVIMGGVSFYQRREVKDILAYLKMVQSGTDYLAFERTINLPKRGIGETTLDKIKHGASEEGKSIFSFCEAIADNLPLKSTIRLTSKQKQGLTGYVEIIRDLRKVHQECSLKQLVESAIDRSDYLAYLREDQESYDDRKANLNSLMAKADEWGTSSPEATLESFLEELSLKSTLDDADHTKDRVHLMTIHNGKGLEYTAVFLVGMEENIFPHASAKDDMSELEEERRLCYVGMTRAKEYLYLSDVRSRFMWGRILSQSPSRFLSEIPSGFIEQVKSVVRRTEMAKEVPIKEEESFSDDMDQTIPEGLEEPMQEGQVICHSEFGVGVIQKVYQGSAGLTYKILFSKDNRERSIVARYVKLKKI